MANDGLKIETAAGVMLRDAVRKHMTLFALTISANRHTGMDVVAVYVDGLAAAMALTIAGSHGSKDDVVFSVLTKLSEALDRDLQHLGEKQCQALTADTIRSAPSKSSARSTPPRLPSSTRGPSATLFFRATLYSLGFPRRSARK